MTSLEVLYTIVRNKNECAQYAQAKNSTKSREDDVALIIHGRIAPPRVGRTRVSAPLAPLDGIRVVEVGTMITAPLAGSVLAEMGADVIKVERPNGGDPFRNFLGGNYAPHFRAYNKNKASVTLDLSATDGKDAFRSLLVAADVLIENFRPGVMARLGFPDEAIATANPELIHCSITGYGEDGPYADRPAYDTVAQALSGIASLLIDPARPGVSGPTISDNVTGMYAAQGILAALVARRQGRRIRRVSVSMLDASIAFIPDSFAMDDEGFDVDQFTRVRASQSFAMNCADGRMLAIHLSSQEKFWNALLSAIDNPDLAVDARFSSRKGRYENYAELQAALDKAFRKKPFAEWADRLDSVDIPFAPILNVKDVKFDMQVAHQEMLAEKQGADGKTYTMVQSPLRFDGLRPAIRRAAPMLGQDNEPILGSVAPLAGKGDTADG